VGLRRARQAWRYAIECGTGIDSPVAVNTHGGISQSLYPRHERATEAVRQLRGTAANQVQERQIAAVCAPFGKSASSSAIGREALQILPAATP